ncbi:MAG: NUDIX hydrolase [Candidatus Woesearchaeota archaeon]
MDDLIDICDENNNFLGMQKLKTQAHSEGLWHRTAHIWIYNSKGEVLLQLRAKEKALYPDVWDISAAGHVIAGEDPLDSALREVEEEIGLKIKNLDFWMIRKNKAIFREIKNNEFYYIYLYRFDGDISCLTLQKEEVQGVRFFSIDKIKEDLRVNADIYVPHGDYWFEAFDEISSRL